MNFKFNRIFKSKSIKRFISCFIALTLVFSLITTSPTQDAFADTGDVIDSGTCGTGVIWKLTQLEDNTYCLTLCPTQEGTETDDFKTPANTNGEAVPWVDYITEITEFVVEDGITYLGDRLCYGATALKSISIPESVTGTGNGLFRGCTHLEEAVIPGAVTEMVDNLFYACTALKTVTLGEGTTVIGRNMVNGCTALTTLNIPNTITSIDQTPFKNTDSLTTINYSGTIEEYKTMLTCGNDSDVAPIKDSSIAVMCSNGTYYYSEDEQEVGSIVQSGTCGTNVKYTLEKTAEGEYKLTLTPTAENAETNDYGTPTSSSPVPWVDYLTEITEFVVEDGVTYLGNRLCYGATSLESISIPESVTGTGNGLFRSCTSLDEAELPGAITNMVDNLFYKCTDLKKVTLGEGTTMLGRNMVYGCTALEELTFPGTVITINENALYGLSNITTINYNGTVDSYKELLDLEYGSPLKNSGITVYCSDGEYQYGINGTAGENIKWSLSQSTGVLTISGSGAMADYESATNAPWYIYNRYIETILIMDGITYIGANAFGKCTGLENVYYFVPDEEWKNLEETAGEGNEPLFNAYNVQSKLYGTCGDDVTWSLSEDLTTLTISGTGEMYDYSSTSQPWSSAMQPWYYTRNDITNIIVKEGVTYVGKFAFYQMTKVTDITFPSTLEELGTLSVSLCTLLTKVTLPEGLKVIGAKAFESDSKISTVYVPVSLKTVDMKGFNADVSITDVYYSGTEQQWNKIEISNETYGNQYLINANIHYAENTDVSTIYSDVATDSTYHDAIQYLYNNGYISAADSFGVNENATYEDILNVLYIKAGSSAVYESASGWAIENEIIEEEGTTVTGEVLNAIFNNMAVYNGFESYNAGLTAGIVITKGEAAQALTTFLQSDYGTADRYDNIISQLKEVINAGGDGNLYITAVDLHMPEISHKRGDSTFIVFPDGETMLIDSGSSYYLEKMLGFIEDVGITSLDYMVLSHPDADHVDNLDDVAKYLVEKGGTVKNYLYTGYDSSNSSVSALQTYLESIGTTMNTNVKEGDSFTISDVTIDIYGPSESQLANVSTSDDSASNDASMVMKFTYGTSTYLTAGDLYTDKEKELVKKYGSALQSDVVKLNHHGAYTSNSGEWANTVRAQIVLVEAADKGAQYIFDTFTDLGAAIYGATVDETVMVVMDDSRNYSVVTGTDSTLRSEYKGESEELNEVYQVEELIDAISRVDINSKDAIDAATDAYNNLSSSQQDMVYSDKLATLNEAIATYEQLVADSETTGADETTSAEESTGSEDVTGTKESTGTEDVTGQEETTAVGTAKNDVTTDVGVKETTTASAEVVKAPAKAKIKQVKKKKTSAKKIKIVIKNASDASGWQVAVYKSKKNAKKNTKAVVKKNITKRKTTIKSKKFKNKKKLFARVRAYTIDSNGNKVYGKWSKVKKVKIK